MKQIPILLILLAGAAAAQDTGAAVTVNTQKKPEVVERLFVLKYADPQQVSDLLHVFEASITPNTAFHALAIRTAPSTMTALEQTIARLDVPSAAPRDIDLTAQLLLGAGSPEHAGDALPKDLESVVAQLRQSFPFKNYGLLDVLTLRLRTGRTNGQTSTSSVGGTIQVEGRAMPVNSSLNLNGVSLGGDAAEVRIDGFRFSTRIPVSNGPGQVSMNDIGMHTDLDIKDGQKVVVGRLGINPGQALFVVLTAKVL